MTDAVIIFARLPEKGKVKTRLAKTLGKDFALTFYKVCAEHTFNECRKAASGETAIYVFYADENDKELIKDWAGNGFRFLPQRGEDMGERMKNAFQDVFDEGVKQAILIGTDIPDISSGIISTALILLDKNEIVIGPAKDGGYYLIGMKKLYRFLFEKIDWGTDKVFVNTLNKLITNNSNIEIITGLYDIDTEENLKEWMYMEHGDKINPVRNFVREYYRSIKTLK